MRERLAPQSAACATRYVRPGGLARRASRLLVLLAAGIAASGCASDADRGFDVDFAESETRIDYDIALEGAPSEDIAGLVEASLGLYRRQEEGAQSVAFLRKRARDDVATIETILRSEGYYEGTAEIRVDEGAAPSADAAAAANASGSDTPAPDGPARVTVEIRPGPRYTLARHDFTLADIGDAPPDLPGADAFGAPVGGPAAAAAIVSAERAAARHLRERGRPYAQSTGRDAVADPGADTLEIDSRIATGPAYVYGPLTFSGIPNVSEAYLRTYLPWEPGTEVDTRRLAEFQRRLVATDLFSAVTVRPPDDPPEGDALPIAVEAEEAPFRSASAGLRFNTDTGPAVRLGFEHRNLFGANERLTLALEAELEEQEFDLRFSKPQFFVAGQFLELRLNSFRAEDSPFDATGATAQAGIRREIGEHLSLGAAGLAEFAVIDQRAGTAEALLFGVPLYVAWDTTDDLLNATTGQRARLTLTPLTGSYDGEATTFLQVEGTGAAFHDLTGTGDYVLAARGRLGTKLLGELDDVPETRRFYSGGGGSVRGYERYLLGPLDDRNDPIGGLSVAEAAIEFRGRIWQDVGGVAFVDAGTVSTESAFAFDDDLLAAAGLGLRYYSPVGPIRIDAAFPINGREVDDTFQVYFSVGQAF